MNYISSEEIINEVKNKLSTYFESGYIDESLLYRKIRLCVSQMGGKIRPFKTKVLRVTDYGAALPKDFYKLTKAIGCLSYVATIKDTKVSKYKEVPLTEQEICNSVCDRTYCEDNCGNKFKVIQSFPEYTLEWNEFYNLSLSADSIPFCEDGCFNYYTPNQVNEIKVEQDLLRTNFSTGWVYIEYLGQLEVDGSYMIPDKEQIIDWIIDELRVECFEYLFDNGLQDVQGKLLNAKNDLQVSKLAARSFYKQNEVKDFYNMSNMLIRRYQKFNINKYDRKPVYSKYY